MNSLESVSQQSAEQANAEHPADRGWREYCEAHISRLEAWKIRNGLSTGKVAVLLGLSPRTVANWLKRKSAPVSTPMTLQQNKALALAPFVTVDPNSEVGVPGPNITFSGVNIHIVNGMGQTQLVNGLGNLILGYDEFQPLALQPYDRQGSHNIVIGRFHDWYKYAFGCLMAGSWNWASNEGCFVAGYQSEAAGLNSSVLGGSNNVINTGNYSVILGGQNNLESGNWQILQ
jgi:hypothetical protein